MSLSTPIFTLTCWALAPPQARAAASAASPKVLLISGPPLCFEFGLAADERTIAFLQRTKSFIGGNCRAQFVEVTRILRLLGLLDFEEVGRMQLAAVGADRSLAE